MKFQSQLKLLIRKLLDTQETLNLQQDRDSLVNPQIIKKFFVSHHQDSIQIALIRKGNAT